MGRARTLLNCNDLHPLGQWYRVTAVYDGKTLRNYVGDEMQGEGELHMTPQGRATRRLERGSTGAITSRARFSRRGLRRGRLSRRSS